jgi:hypothetical protein
MTDPNGISARFRELSFLGADVVTVAEGVAGAGVVTAAGAGEVEVEGDEHTP